MSGFCALTLRIVSRVEAPTYVICTPFLKENERERERETDRQTERGERARKKG